jgi:glycerophosphoryl diester phosphodiesterase
MIRTCLMLAGICSFCSGVYGVEIIAHRGASAHAPENTLAAVNLAWQIGADAVEVDVYLSSDGHIVVMHDDTTKRTGGRDWKISERTLAELRTLDVGSWKGPTWAGEKIPTLAEVLATIPSGKRLFIEIKCGPDIAAPLAEVLAEAGRPAAETVVIAFKLPVAEAVKRRLPGMRVYWLYSTSPKKDKETGRLVDHPEELLEVCRRAGLDGLDLGYESQLTPEFVARIRDLGLGLYVWTVNKPDVAQRLHALGVDGITTDDPRLIREHLEVGR